MKTHKHLHTQYKKITNSVDRFAIKYMGIVLIIKFCTRMLVTVQAHGHAGATQTGPERSVA